ncbi:MAG: hypothetical protein J1F39_02550 [Clostridiales bacterium]|nr:hypothetical protein [Clostridiales bacterium]
MKLSKAQGIVITLLNIVIVALVAVLLFVPEFSILGSVAVGGKPDDDPPQIVPDDPPVHNKLRAPSEGKAEGILSETRLMGLGDESVVKTFFLFGSVYIFGNATVKGLDFDYYGGYICKLSEEGEIKAFSYLDEMISAVAAYGETFIAAAGKSVYSVDTDCNLTVRVEQTDGDALDVLPIDNGMVAVISQPLSTSLKLTEYSVNEWASGHITRIDSVYSLKYLGCFDMSDRYVLAARAHSLPRYDSLVMYSFIAGGDGTLHSYGGDGENTVHPYAVMPCGNGFVAACSKNGIATVLFIDYSFTLYHVYTLGFTATGAKLVYSSVCYACFEGADGFVTYKAQGTVKPERVSAFDGIKVCAARGGLFMGVVPGGEGGAVAVFDEGKTLVSFSVSGGEAYSLERSGDKIKAVISATGGEGVSAPSGGRDVYYLVLKG